jgi:hypothetical protein
MSETGQDAYNAPLHDGAPGTGLPRDVPGQGFTAQRRRGRRRTRLLAAAGLVAAVGGVTAALLVASGSGAPSALAAVIGALAKTSAESYSFGLNFTVEIMGREMNSDVVSGTIDPQHRLGTELLTTSVQHRPATAQIRFIGKYVYTRVSAGPEFDTLGKPWNVAPVPPARASEMPGGGSYGFVSDQPVSPGELSGLLRSGGTAHDAGPASGPGWTGTRYTFTALLSGGQGAVSGAVYVDWQGQVRRLVTVTTQGRLTAYRDITFDDFGAPVQVTAPPSSQEKYTSTPHWGFFF